MAYVIVPSTSVSGIFLMKAKVLSRQNGHSQSIGVLINVNLSDPLIDHVGSYI